MEQYQVGKLLKEYRKRKKISQEELAFGLCEVSTLSRIERGEQIPNRKLVQLLFERLNEGLPSLDIPMNKYDFDRYNLEVRIQSMVARNDYEIAELLQEYSSLEQKMNKFELQFHEFYQALYHMRHRTKTNEDVLNDFCNAMKITVKDFTLDTSMDDYLLTQTEIFILNNIAITEYYIGWHEKAIKRMEFLKAYFDTNDVEEKERIYSYKIFLFHLSNWTGEAGDSKKSLEYAEEGIEECRLYGNLHIFPYFVFNKGYALAELGQKEEGKKYIKMAFDMMNLLGFKKDLEYGMENVKKTFGFDFS